MRAAALVVLAACWSAPVHRVAPAPRAAVIHRRWPPAQPPPELPVRASRRAPIPLVVFAEGPPLATREPAADELERLRREAAAARGRARIAALDRLTAALEAIADTWTDPAKVGDAADAYRALLAERAIEMVPHGDELIYRAARALHYAHDELTAAAAFDRMIAVFPQSLYAGDAAAAAADCVAALDPSRARQLYAQAIASGRPTAADYARYQLILFYLARSELAEALTACVDLANHGANADLREIAARMAVRPYIEAGAPGGAYTWFQQIAPGIAGELVEALAEAYLDGGRPADALAALDEAAGRQATDEDRCYDRVLALRAKAELAPAPEVITAAEAVVAAARTADGCKPDADQRLGEIAWAWQRHVGAPDADRPRVARMWKLAVEVATTPERRAVASRDLAQLAWELAEADPRGWPAAAEAMDAAAEATGDAQLAAAAREARANARRR